MLNLWQMSFMECFLMPQNARITAFTVSELLKEVIKELLKLGGQSTSSLTPPRLELNNLVVMIFWGIEIGY